MSPPDRCSTTRSPVSSRASTSPGRPRPRRSRACSCSTTRWPRSWGSTALGLDVLAGNATPAGATPIAQAYAGHQFGGFTAARRRARAAAGRGARRPRPAPRHPPQGLGPHAVLARRRRQGRPRADAARVRDRRGDARARHPHHAGARGRRHRRAGGAGHVPAGRGPDPRGRQPPPRRDVRVRRAAPRPDPRQAARRLRDRAPLPGRRTPRSRSSRRSSRPRPR